LRGSRLLRVPFKPSAESFKTGVDTTGFNDRDRGGSQGRLHSKSFRRIAGFSGPPEIKRRKFYIADGNFKLIKAPLAGPAGGFENHPQTHSGLR